MATDPFRMSESLFQTKDLKSNTQISILRYTNMNCFQHLCKRNPKEIIWVYDQVTLPDCGATKFTKRQLACPEKLA